MNKEPTTRLGPRRYGQPRSEYTMCYVSSLFLRCAVLATILCAVGTLSAQTPSNSRVPEIPYTRFILGNGLTVIVHEDHTAPSVHVGVWYRVGSRDEPAGRTGFAHLFEHLMFGGSEHFRGDYLVALRNLGLTLECGETWYDVTRFCVNAPVGALDTALWLESDRMGFLLGAIDQQRLDATRGGVRNERRQNFEDRPYGNVALLTPPATYSPGHPYAHHPIGSQADLDAASLEDVRQWSRTYYTPNNAFLVLSGAVDPATARQKVEKFFGGLPPGPQVPRTTKWQAPMADERRDIVTSRVPFPRVYRTWITPEATAADADYLLLAANILATGPESRLARLLVDEQKLATAVAVDYEFNVGELSSQMSLNATARNPDALRKIDSLILAEVDRLARSGPTPAELERVRRTYFDGFVRGLERPGAGAARAGRAMVLGNAELLWRDPSAYRIRPSNIASATAADVQNAVKRWLTRASYALEISPAPVVRAGERDADRSRMPPVDDTVVVPSLDFSRRTLANGLTVVVVPRPSSRLLQLSLSVPAGFAYDPPDRHGVAGVFMKLWGKRTASRSVQDVRDALQTNSATLSTTLEEQTATLTMSTFASNLTTATSLFADLATQPSLDAADVAAGKQSLGTTLATEQNDAGWLMLRVGIRLAYGADHPYAATLQSGTGGESELAAITAADLATFARERVTPNGATLIVAGGVDNAVVDSLVDRLFGSWKGKAGPQRPVPVARTSPKPVIYLVDVPSSTQSYVMAVQRLDQAANPYDPATDAMISVLGRDYASRLNANLRLEKGWTYFARVELNGPPSQPYLWAYTPVQADKTAETVTEIARELADIRGPRPVTVAELQAVQRNRTGIFATRWAGTGSVAADVRTIVQNNLPPDYYQRFAEQYAALTPDMVTRAAASIIQPDKLVWLVVGDRRRIEPSLRALGRGEVQVLDANARPIASDKLK